QDEIGLRYNSHRTKREEYLVMSGDEFMERFSWHVADKGFRMVAKWHLNRSQFGIRIDHDLASISDHSLASQSITIWHTSDH
ncbi:hypothetical protein AW089_27350, partial [Escherichia coli]